MCCAITRSRWSLNSSLWPVSFNCYIQQKYNLCLCMCWTFARWIVNMTMNIPGTIIFYRILQRSGFNCGKRHHRNKHTLLSVVNQSNKKQTTLAHQLMVPFKVAMLQSQFSFILNKYACKDSSYQKYQVFSMRESSNHTSSQPILLSWLTDPMVMPDLRSTVTQIATFTSLQKLGSFTNVNTFN